MNDVVAYESKYGGIILDSSQAPASVVTIKGESSKNPEVEIIPYFSLYFSRLIIQFSSLLEHELDVCF